MSSIKGKYRITVIDESGQIKQDITSENLITTKGYFNLFYRSVTGKFDYKTFMNKAYLIPSTTNFVASTESISTSGALAIDVTQETVPLNLSTVDTSSPLKIVSKFVGTIITGSITNCNKIAGFDGNDLVSLTELPEPINKTQSDIIKLTYTLEYEHPWVESITNSGQFEVGSKTYNYTIVTDKSSTSESDQTGMGTITDPDISKFLYEVLHPNDYFGSFEEEADHGGVTVTSTEIIINCKHAFNVSESMKQYFNDVVYKINKGNKLTVSQAIDVSENQRIVLPGVRWIFTLSPNFRKDEFDRLVESAKGGSSSDPYIPPEPTNCYYNSEGIYRCDVSEYPEYPIYPPSGWKIPT